MSRVVVYHNAYGCDTGCCAHGIEVDDKHAAYGLLEHPDDGATDDEKREWAKEFLREKLGDEHVADLDWESSEVYTSAECGW